MWTAIIILFIIFFWDSSTHSKRCRDLDDRVKGLEEEIEEIKEARETGE